MSKKEKCLLHISIQFFRQSSVISKKKGLRYFLDMIFRKKNTVAFKIKFTYGPVELKINH